MTTSSNSTCLSGERAIPLTTNISCLDGFFCPNNNAEHPPEYCPPTPECQLRRLQESNSICDQPQGEYEPAICKAGSFCPPGGQSQVKCPNHHFCPWGSVKPTRCISLSACPEGSSLEVPLIGFVFVLLLDLFLVAIATGLLPQFSVFGHWVTRVKLSWPIRGRQGKKNPDSENCTRTHEPCSVMDRFFENFLHIIPARPEIEIAFQGVSKRLKGSKYDILRPQGGRVRAGRFLGLMGPSGAGKSTLLDILTGRINPTTGALYINGHKVHCTELRDLVGYVPQNDTLLADLTIRETLLFSARIRIGNSCSSKDLAMFVDSLIAALGLEKVRFQRVGDASKRSLSGGERKRVNIGLELVAAPQVLVLDEPTSGLDAKTALDLMELLKSLASNGTIIICALHQPRTEIFALLDDLLLLQAGQQMYFGCTAEALQHLEASERWSSLSPNPADMIMDALASGYYHCQSPSTLLDRRESIREPQEVNKRHDDAKASVKLSLSSIRLRRASWHKQVVFVFVRGMTQQCRQTSSLLLEMISGTIIGIFIGLSNYEFRGHLFQGLFQSPFESLSSAVSYRLLAEQSLLSCLAIACIAGPAGVKTFGDEKLVFYRESQAGHSESAYFLGKVISTFPRIVLSAIHYTTFFMVLTTPIISFNLQLALNFLYFYCIYGLGCIVAAITRPRDGPLMAMLISLIISAMSGCGPRLVSVKTWHLEWFWYIWPALWYSEANFNENTAPLAHLYNVQAGADTMGYTTGRTVYDIGILIIIGSVYRLISFCLMVFFPWRQPE